LTGKVFPRYIEFEVLAMKKCGKAVVLFVGMSFIGISINTYSAGFKKDTALLLIRIQNYFPGGRSELGEPETVSLNAQKFLRAFREKASSLHFSTLSSLDRCCAKVLDTENFLKEF
jgi:hypothetical protein